ncbi:hypothetical protein CBR_g27804 [Chara braunii]|uniref:Uncharacterized protein n=1 Tax=Chara braunii TaxID=69332 RepID=A0A388L8D9_CHABU|nr:hypothetical protein CBR_g27804 [Chara braunii]|eukprot:GBG78579.1 hypothetical protein CBR_g27804 [Chara braunii]
MTDDAWTRVAPAVETMSTRIGAHFSGLERGLVGEIHHRDTSFDMVDDVWIREDDGQDEVDVINYFALSAVYVDGGSEVDEQVEEDVINFNTDEDGDMPFYTDDGVGQREVDGQDEGDVAKYYAHLTAVYFDTDEDGDTPLYTDVDIGQREVDGQDEGDVAKYYAHLTAVYEDGGSGEDEQREVDGQNEGDVAKHFAHLTVVYKDGGLQDDEDIVLQGDGDQPEVGEEEQGSMVEAGVNVDKEQRMEEWEVAQEIMAEAVAAVEDRQVMGETGDNSGRADDTNDKKNNNIMMVITAGVMVVVDERQVMGEIGVLNRVEPILGV